MIKSPPAIYVMEKPYSAAQWVKYLKSYLMVSEIKASALFSFELDIERILEVTT
jgi:hypothetical protein